MSKRYSTKVDGVSKIQIDPFKRQHGYTFKDGTYIAFHLIRGGMRLRYDAEGPGCRSPYYTVAGTDILCCSDEQREERENFIDAYDLYLGRIMGSQAEEGK